MKNYYLKIRDKQTKKLKTVAVFDGEYKHALRDCVCCYGELYFEYEAWVYHGTSWLFGYAAGSSHEIKM